MFENIIAKDIIVGENVFIEPSAVIKGTNGRAERIEIGDNVYIGERVQIICDNFKIGDYSKIHHDANIHGYLPCIIGHNAWIGQYAIIDSIGGVVIGNNCGIGAHSQLWSHIKFGDTLEGCRFLSQSKLSIGNDVWFVGHCIVSPVNVADKAMALAGSVITKDMNYNEIYAGSPAKSISDKIGFQFQDVSIDEKIKKMTQYLVEWGGEVKTIKIVRSNEEMTNVQNVTYFNVSNREYNKRRTAEEISFMKFLLPARAKFIPKNDKDPV